MTPLQLGTAVRVLLPALGGLKIRTGTVIGPPRPGGGYLVRLDEDATSAVVGRSCLDPLKIPSRWERLLGDWLN